MKTSTVVNKQPLTREQQERISQWIVKIVHFERSQRSIKILDLAVKERKTSQEIKNSLNLPIERRDVRTILQQMD